MPAVRSDFRISADGRFLFRGHDGVIEFAEPRPGGLVRKVAVKHPCCAWEMSLSSDYSLAAYTQGELEEGESELWVVRLKAASSR